MSQWWVSRNHGTPVGPVTTEVLLRGIATGRVPTDVHVCRVGQQQWFHLSDIPEIWNRLQPPAAQPVRDTWLDDDFDETDATQIFTRPSSPPPVVAPSAPIQPHRIIAATQPHKAAPVLQKSPVASPPLIDAADEDAVTVVTPALDMEEAPVAPAPMTAAADLLMDATADEQSKPQPALGTLQLAPTPARRPAPPTRGAATKHHQVPAPSVVLRLEGVPYSEATQPALRALHRPGTIQISVTTLLFSALGLVILVLLVVLILR